MIGYHPEIDAFIDDYIDSEIDVDAYLNRHLGPPSYRRRNHIITGIAIAGSAVGALLSNTRKMVYGDIRTLADLVPTAVTAYGASVASDANMIVYAAAAAHAANNGLQVLTDPDFLALPPDEQADVMFRARFGRSRYEELNRKFNPPTAPFKIPTVKAPPTVAEATSGGLWENVKWAAQKYANNTELAVAMKDPDPFDRRSNPYSLSDDALFNVLTARARGRSQSRRGPEAVQLQQNWAPDRAQRAWYETAFNSVDSMAAGLPYFADDVLALPPPPPQANNPLQRRFASGGETSNSAVGALNGASSANTAVGFADLPAFPRPIYPGGYGGVAMLPKPRAPSTPFEQPALGKPEAKRFQPPGFPLYPGGYGGIGATTVTADSPPGQLHAYQRAVELGPVNSQGQLGLPAPERLGMRGKGDRTEVKAKVQERMFAPEQPKAYVRSNDSIAYETRDPILPTIDPFTDPETLERRRVPYDPGDEGGYTRCDFACHGSQVMGALGLGRLGGLI